MDGVRFYADGSDMQQYMQSFARPFCIDQAPARIRQAPTPQHSQCKTARGMAPKMPHGSVGEGRRQRMEQMTFICLECREEAIAMEPGVGVCWRCRPCPASAVERLARSRSRSPRRVAMERLFAFKVKVAPNEEDKDPYELTLGVRGNDLMTTLRHLVKDHARSEGLDLSRVQWVARGALLRGGRATLVENGVSSNTPRCTVFCVAKPMFEHTCWGELHNYPQE